MIVVTGGAGFIGSNMIKKLNDEGIDEILVVDSLKNTEKWRNLIKLKFNDYIEKEKFHTLFVRNCLPTEITTVIHFGACSSTVEKNSDYLIDNNFHYSVDLWKWCREHQVRFIYASSAATYGNSRNFSDDDTNTKSLKPANIYGYSKQLFDLWVLRNRFDDLTVGLKLFNVFGPNEYHKRSMASMVYQTFNNIKETGIAKLFKLDSIQKERYEIHPARDFIYVKDVVDVIWWLINNKQVTGIYNLGTGIARLWEDLASLVFSAMHIPPVINYIPIPDLLKFQYQFYTQADIGKLKSTGCPTKFRTLEDSIADYVQNYLTCQDQYI